MQRAAPAPQAAQPSARGGGGRGRGRKKDAAAAVADSGGGSRPGSAVGHRGKSVSCQERAACAGCTVAPIGELPASCPGSPHPSVHPHARRPWPLPSPAPPRPSRPPAAPGSSSSPRVTCSPAPAWRRASTCPVSPVPAWQGPPARGCTRVLPARVADGARCHLMLCLMLPMCAGRSSLLLFFASIAVSTLRLRPASPLTPAPPPTPSPTHPPPTPPPTRLPHPQSACTGSGWTACQARRLLPARRMRRARCASPTLSLAPHGTCRCCAQTVRWVQPPVQAERSAAA